MYPGDIKSVLLAEATRSRRRSPSSARSSARTTGETIAEDAQDLLVTVLKGAVFFVTDLARAIPAADPAGVHGGQLVRVVDVSPRAWCASSRTSTATSTTATC